MRRELGLAESCVLTSYVENLFYTAVKIPGSLCIRMKNKYSRSSPYVRAYIDSKENHSRESE